ncbi:MAG: hypothetical protein KAJ07_10995 [Planctomycetes bacterium]|nr:hypothetical protein [Planctomycetota bacterium]
MKNMFLIMIFAILLMGCQEQFQNDSMEVTLNDGGRFPSFLVGTWENEGSVWSFTFGPDGRILSMIHALGGVELRPGEITTEPTRGGGKAIYEPGKWLVRYDSEDRILSVDIVLDNVHLEIGGGVLEGSRTDVFGGKVSDDGTKWTADSCNLLDMIAYVPEPRPMKVDWADCEISGKTLVFEKVKKLDTTK